MDRTAETLPVDQRLKLSAACVAKGCRSAHGGQGGSSRSTSTDDLNSYWWRRAPLGSAPSARRCKIHTAVAGPVATNRCARAPYPSIWVPASSRCSARHRRQPDGAGARSALSPRARQRAYQRLTFGGRHQFGATSLWERPATNPAACRRIHASASPPHRLTDIAARGGNSHATMLTIQPGPCHWNGRSSFKGFGS